MTVGVGEAAVGEVLKTVTIPNEANCASDGSDFGEVLAVVPGGKLGFPGTPTLVVTNCEKTIPVGELSSTIVSRLFFLDPSTNPATVKGTVDAGTAQWQALVFRADTADLLGCQPGFEGPLVLSVIHFSPYDTVAAPGNVSFLTTAPSTATCAGVAWDSKDKSIYQTSFQVPTGASSQVILKYTPGNAGAATSISSGCAGVAVTPWPLMIAKCPGWRGSAATQLAGNGAAWRVHVAPSSRLVSKMPQGQVRPGAADAV